MATVEGKKIKELPTITTISDTDDIICEKSTPKTYRISFLNFAKSIVEKLKTLQVSTLKTTDKTLPGAINELNSKITNIYGGTITSKISISNSYGSATIDVSKTGAKAISLNAVEPVSTFYAIVATTFDIANQRAYVVLRKLNDSTTTQTIDIKLYCTYITK